jgi:hypothetical protein
MWRPHDAVLLKCHDDRSRRLAPTRFTGFSRSGTRTQAAAIDYLAEPRRGGGIKPRVERSGTRGLGSADKSIRRTPAGGGGTRPVLPWSFQEPHSLHCFLHRTRGLEEVMRFRAEDERCFNDKGDDSATPSGFGRWLLAASDPEFRCAPLGALFHHPLRGFGRTSAVNDICMSAAISISFIPPPPPGVRAHICCQRHLHVGCNFDQYLWPRSLGLS